MSMRLPRFLALAAFLALRCATAETPPDDADPRVAGFPAFVAWFRAHNGYVDDAVAVAFHEARREGGARVRGLVAAAALPAGTLLFRTPASLLLSPPPAGHATWGGQGGGIVPPGCDLIATAQEELRRGTESRWHEYFAFDDAGDGTRVPGRWSRATEGGRAAWELQGLPPAGATHRHVDWYRQSCRGDHRRMTDLDWRALTLYLTRSVDVGLVPMYDLMNHHNGRVNTERRREADGARQALAVYAATDLRAGEPIYGTYARAGGESTVDVFNTYGFVEDYPQLWRWGDNHLAVLSEHFWDDAQHRYTRVCDDAAPDAGGDCLHLEPNTAHHEVLVLSPTRAALLPSKRLVRPLGNERLSGAAWEERVAVHHRNLRASYARALGASAAALLDELPTTIEEDEAWLPEQKMRHEEDRRRGEVDVNRADTIQAIEFRLAFKKALKLTAEVAKGDIFVIDPKEL